MQTELKHKADKFAASELERAHDPFSDDEPLPVEKSSKESIRSFWVCIAGLAVLAHTAIYFGLQLMPMVNDWLWRQYNVRWFNPPRYVLYLVFSNSFVPCLILATVVPILYWRGGLAHRFVIALTIAVATMNSSIDTRGFQVVDRSPLLAVLTISGCWAMFPILFLFTPIRTERLRLVVATCLLVLTVCVSFINMADLRRSHEFLYWQTLFGSAFIYAILRRNWGKVAMLESSATEVQIERTSSGTLLELMAVCGLASASYMYFSQSSYDRPISYYLQGSLLGVVSILVSMSCMRRFQAWKLGHIPWLILFWFVISSLFYMNTLMNFYSQRTFGVSWRALIYSPEAIFSAAFSGVASLLLLCYLWSLGLWLRLCGWRLADKPE